MGNKTIVHDLLENGGYTGGNPEDFKLAPSFSFWETLDEIIVGT